MTTSGTYSFNPSLSDVVIEAFDRCGIRASELTPDHIISARRSINLIQSVWSNKGVNLFAVDQQSIPLVQGVTTYSVPSNTIMILDTFIRTYPLNAPVNITPDFTTISSSATVNVYQASHGLSVGNYINIIIPVSVGGIIISAYYQVVSVIDINNYTITAASTATSSTTGGTVPLFSTTANSDIVNVTFPNHGYLAGQPFVVQISTAVGGLTLFGTYTIDTVTDVNNFTFTNSSGVAGSASVAYENNGAAQVAGQNTTAQLVDRVMGPMSRTDYNSLPNKSQQGFPTIYWYDRLINPTITIWQVADGNGPYQLFYYRVRQIQDSNPVNGQVAEIPYRFLEALCAGTAFHLSMKWAMDKSIALKAYYDEVLNIILEEDREVVPMRFAPDFSSYYNG